MKTGEVHTLTAFSNPLKMPLINLPLGSSSIVIASFFLPFFFIYFIFGLPVSLISGVVIGVSTLRYLKKRYNLDPDYASIQRQNKRRKQPFNRNRFYAS